MSNRKSFSFIHYSLFIALLLFAGGCQPNDATPDPQQAAAPEAAGEAEEAELAAYMSNLQRWSHKLLLGIEAENQAVSEFYLHELEEQAEQVVAEVPSYEGYPISDLVETMLVPQIEVLHAALEGGDWAAVRAQAEILIQACNQCHTATDHGFIQITTATGPNPYNQDFSPPQ